MEHASGVVGGVGVGLHTEVAEHGVGSPAAEELDGVLVHPGAEEGSGPTRSEAAGGQVFGIDAGDVADGGGSVTEGVRDPRRVDVSSRLGAGRVIGADRSVGRSTVIA